jgi:hypothetical protein
MNEVPVTARPTVYRARPSLDGVSLMVDRIADSPYGLFEPLPDGTADLGTNTTIPKELPPEPLWMNPEWTVPAPPAPDRRLREEEVAPLIELEASRNGIDPLLIEAVVRNESGFDPYAVSNTGAQGLMQLMPDTAALCGVADPFDPAQNIAGGSLYLSWQLRNFGGDVALAVAAYNAGPAAVQRWGGVPPYPETVEYVKRVVEDYRALQQLRAAQSANTSSTQLPPGVEIR